MSFYQTPSLPCPLQICVITGACKYYVMGSADMQQFCFACFGAQLDEPQLQATWSHLGWGFFFFLFFVGPSFALCGPTYPLNPCDLPTQSMWATYSPLCNYLPSCNWPLTQLLTSSHTPPSLLAPSPSYRASLPLLGCVSWCSLVLT